MITAVDSNVLIDLFAMQGESEQIAKAALAASSKRGSVVLSIVAYAESPLAFSHAKYWMTHSIVCVLQ